MVGHLLHMVGSTAGGWCVMRRLNPEQVDAAEREIAVFEPCGPRATTASSRLSTGPPQDHYPEGDLPRGDSRARRARRRHPTVGQPRSVRDDDRGDASAPMTVPGRPANAVDVPPAGWVADSRAF